MNQDKLTYGEALKVLKAAGVKPIEYKHLTAEQVIRLAAGKNIATK